MYADRANMILMTGFLISGMVAIPVALIVLWHMHSRKKDELRQLKEGLRMRNMYTNYMVPPGSARENSRMFATMEGPYDPQRWPVPTTDPEHWAAMRMMLGSRDQPRQLGATAGQSASATGESFVLGNSNQFANQIYRPAMMAQCSAQPYAFPSTVTSQYGPMVPLTLPTCQKQPGMPAPMPAAYVTASPANTTDGTIDGSLIPPGVDSNHWRTLLLQAQQQLSAPSVAGSTGSMDWVKNLGAVPRQIDVSLDHANTVGGCLGNEGDNGDRAASDPNSQQQQQQQQQQLPQAAVAASGVMSQMMQGPPPPIQTKHIPASQLAS